MMANADEHLLQVPTAERLTVEALASQPSWPGARVARLPGRCRGALLRAWAIHVARRWGPSAVDQARQMVGVPVGELPDEPRKTRWYPLSYQIGLTGHIIDHHLGGDALALEPLLVEDARRNRDKVLSWAMKHVPLAKVVAAAPKVHERLYDRGAVEVDMPRSGDAVVRWRGAEFFENPTWRLLQLFAARATIKALGHQLVQCWGFDGSPGEFGVRLGWR